MKNDDRLDYIAKMLNDRTKGKTYENFIVNAIYSKVGNTELMPVTQQYVKSSNPERPYYLLDLYFPQLNYGVEIDEKHHTNENCQYADDIRAEDISAAIQCKEDRIPIYNNANPPQQRTIAEIEKDIKRVVSTIKKKIARKGGVKWVTNEERKTEIICSRVFRVTDDVNYKGITEIYNLCGGRRNGPHKGEKAKALQRCYVSLNEQYKLWVPKLAVILPDGTVTNTANGYENYLSDDHAMIIEKDVEGKKKGHTSENENKCKRVVFMQMKDRFGKRCVKFMGVYKFFKSFRQKDGAGYVVCTTYKRIATKVAFDDLFP